MQLNLKSATGKVAANTIYQIIGKTISMSITLLATIIITRSYGREGYGQFSLMQTWPALFFVIVDFGINAIAAREIKKDWSKADKYLGNILFFRIIFSLIVIFLLNIVLFLFPYEKSLDIGIRLSLLLLITQSLYSTINIIFQVKLKYSYSTIGYTAGYLVILILILALSYLRIPVMWVNFGYVIGGVVTLTVNLCLVKKLGVKTRLLFDKKITKYLFIQALPLGLMFVFSQMSFKEDSIMLSFLKLPESYKLNNTETVAIYALPYKVFEVMLVIPTFFMNAAYPVLVERMTEGKNKLKRAFSKTILFLTFSGLAVGIAAILFAPWIIKFLGGSGFNQSVNLLRMLGGSIFLFYLTSPLSWLIVTLGYQKKLPLIYAVSALFNLIMNLIFIPRYSFYAATTITIASECIILLMLFYTCRKIWKIKYA